MLKPAVALRHCPSALAQRSKQGGIALIEALVATLLLMLGILALIGLQGRLVGASTDAQLRGEATFLADQIISQMWIEDPDNLGGYAARVEGCGPVLGDSREPHPEKAALLLNLAGTVVDEKAPVDPLQARRA